MQSPCLHFPAPPHRLRSRECPVSALTPLLHSQRYEGYWREDKADGKGTLTCPPRGSNAGLAALPPADSIAADSCCVRAPRLKRYVHGDKYVGDWVAAKKQGQGELYYANGDMFRGEWVQDRASGNGVLMYANNNRYEGQWMDDRRHGQGTFYHADGSRYEGEWATGRKEGKGTLFFANGDTFTGFWSEGAISGQGILSLHEDSPWNIPDL